MMAEAGSVAELEAIRNSSSITKIYNMVDSTGKAAINDTYTKYTQFLKQAARSFTIDIDPFYEINT
jgi:hypothetical protein